ncbi:MAG: dihydrolipoamide acetyltransferase family protein, partial [Usitatibacter sp.]
MIELKLPSMGADMEEGKLLEWKVKPGEPVKRGDVVAVVDTTKAAVDVESWEEGTVHQQLVGVGETVPVGTVIATLLAPGESAPPPGARPAAPSPPPTARKPISPAARARARELGIDVEKIPGTGPLGAVTIEDVVKAAGAAKPADRASEMRRAIAAAMSRSKREIPHYYLAETIPMARAAEWLAAENTRRPVTERLLMGVLQLKAVALALARAPELNGYWRDGAFQPSPAIHIGVAISIREGGLIAPAIHDVDKKSLADLMRDLSDLVSRALAGSLRSSEMSDPTITVTNLGDGGVEAVYGVIYPPQVALVG